MQMNQPTFHKVNWFRRRDLTRQTPKWGIGHCRAARCRNHASDTEIQAVRTDKLNWAVEPASHSGASGERLLRQNPPVGYKHSVKDDSLREQNVSPFSPLVHARCGA